jgi:hypothetical protein
VTKERRKGKRKLCGGAFKGGLFVYDQTRTFNFGVLDLKVGAGRSGIFREQEDAKGGMHRRLGAGSE